MAVQETLRGVDEKTLALTDLPELVKGARSSLERRMKTSDGVDPRWPVPGRSIVQTELMSQVAWSTCKRLIKDAAFTLMPMVSDDIIDVLAPGALTGPLTLSCACAGFVGEGVPGGVSQVCWLGAQVR